MVQNRNVRGYYGGYNYSNNNFRSTYVTGTGQPFTQSTGPLKGMHKSGGIGTVFIGWQKCMQNHYVFGFELEGAISSNKTKLTDYPNKALLPTLNFVVQANRRWTIIPSVTAGKIFNNQVMGYVKLGLDISDYHLKIYDSFYATTYNKDRVRLGIHPAIGIKYPVTPKISVRGELSYTITPGRINNSFQRKNSLATYTAKVKNMQSFAVQIGASYNF